MRVKSVWVLCENSYSSSVCPFLSTAKVRLIVYVEAERSR